MRSFVCVCVCVCVSAPEPEAEPASVDDHASKGGQLLLCDYRLRFLVERGGRARNNQKKNELGVAR